MANTGMRVERLKCDLWRLILVPPYDNEIPTMVVCARTEEEAKEYFGKMIKIMGGTN